MNSIAAARNLIVVGASAGGVPALCRLVAGLPADLDAAVCVVLHIPAHSPTRLDSILTRAGNLPARRATDGEELAHGRILVASQDQHLLVEGTRVRLTRGPRENRARPAIDVLFRSAALYYGTRSIGVILTGMLDDGTAGLWAIKDRGGSCIVQSPHDAEYDSMPANAVAHVKIDYMLPLREIARKLVELIRASVTEPAPATRSHRLQLEHSIALGNPSALQNGVTVLGAPSPISCPECRGVLMSINDDSILRFRCHTGHAYSKETLLAAVDHQIDESLWSAVRVIEERIILLQQLRDAAVRAADDESARGYDEAVLLATQRAEAAKALVLAPSLRSTDPSPQTPSSPRAAAV